MTTEEVCTREHNQTLNLILTITLTRLLNSMQCKIQLIM